MNWTFFVAGLTLLITFCSLIDWFISRDEQIKSKDIVVNWFVKIGEFTYRDSLRNSVVYCTELFTKIYGSKHLTWRCFGVSYILSLAAVCVILPFVSIWQDIISAALSANGIQSSLFKDLSQPYIGLFIFLMLFLNPLVDYVSLIETRYLLRLASQSRLSYLVIWLLFDVLFTLLIILLSYCILSSLWLNPGMTISFSERMWDSMKFFFNGLYGLLFSQKPNVTIESKYFTIFRPLILSTFLTSFLFYFYCLSALFFKLIGKGKKRILIFLENVEGQNHLFKTIGIVIAAILAFIKAIVYLVVSTVK